MASRAFKKMLNSLVENLTFIQCRWDSYDGVGVAPAGFTGQFVPGETVTGGTSSATLVFVGFQDGTGHTVPQGPLAVIMVGYDVSGAFHGTTEVLTGGTSGATVSTAAPFAGSAGYPFNLQGTGVKSVIRSPAAAAVGTYAVELEDSYDYLMGFDYGITNPSNGTAVDDGSFVVGYNYLITTVGTQVGVLTLTLPAITNTVYGVEINGLTISVKTPSTSASLVQAAIAMAVNAEYVTVVPAVPSVSAAQLVVNVPSVVLTTAAPSGAFTLDELVTGGTSGAYGYITTAAAASPLTLVGVVGKFVAGETVTGAVSTNTAVISAGNSVVPNTIQVPVNAYPATNFVPNNAVAAAVTASLVLDNATNSTTSLVDFVTNTPLPSPALPFVKVGAAEAVNFATIPATDWYAAGLPAGVKPALGVPFQAKVVGGAGDGVAELQAAAAANNRFVITGLADPGLQKGGYLFINCQLAAGTPEDLLTGTTAGKPYTQVRWNFFLRNSSIKGQGE